MMLANSFLQQLQIRKSRRIFLTFDLPAAQSAFDLSYSFFGCDRANNCDHHFARTIIFAMKFNEINSLDVLNRFRVAIFRSAVGMSLEENRIEDHRSHVRCILSADLQTG